MLVGNLPQKQEVPMQGAKKVFLFFVCGAFIF